MSDLIKKKKKKFKTTPSPKVKKQEKIAKPPFINNLVRVLHNFIDQLRDIKTLLKIALFITPFNIVFIVMIFHLYSQMYEQNVSRETQNVLPARSITLPQVDASPSALFVSSSAYVVLDTQSRVVVSKKNPHLRFSPASSAKIMTALVALETFKKSQTLTVPSLASVEGSMMGLFEGEQIGVEELLYGLMLPSGNDAAYVLAFHHPAGFEGFIEEMNKKAEAYKLANTHFVDPAGLYDTNYTTAFDMARLGAQAMENPDLRKIVGTKEILVSDITGKIRHPISNLNELLGISGVDGIKTGYTDEAGGVLVTSLVQNDRRYVVVVLRSSDRFGDTKQILDSIISSIRTVSY